MDLDLEVVGQALSGPGKAAASALNDRAREVEITLPAELDAPGGELPHRRSDERPAAEEVAMS